MSAGHVGQRFTTFNYARPTPGRSTSATISASVSSEFREQHLCITISNKKNGHLQGSTGTAMICNKVDTLLD
jgi:hypothetical protein